MYDIEKLEQIGLGDSISLKAYINRTNLSYIQDDIFSAIYDMESNDKNITHFFIDIYVSDLIDAEDTKIGFIRGNIIEFSRHLGHGSFYETCDAESQELEEMASSVVDDDKELIDRYVLDTDTVCYVSDFYIYKKFRNCGIGSYIIEELKDILIYYSRIFIDKIILLPQPRVINNQRHTQNLSDKFKNKEPILESKLRKFYLDNGFREIENSRYMIKRPR